MFGWRWHGGVLFILGFVCFLGAGRARADFRRYSLSEGSSVTVACHSCSTPPAPPEPLTGDFEITVLPASDFFDAAAVTNLRLKSASLDIVGRGFLQRIGPDNQAMVIEARVNGEKVVLTSGRRQRVSESGFSIVLSSGRTGSRTYVLVLAARAEDDRPADADGDGAGDGGDNCPNVPNLRQEDLDGDSVGDACDRCPETQPGDVVTREGCRLEQLCPCEAQASGEAWDGPSQYLRCVARSLRALRRDGQLSRQRSLQLLRRAARSLCGRTVVAAREPNRGEARGCRHLFYFGFSA